jgi:glucokinase
MLIGGIDIGGTKLGACIARRDDDGSIEILDSRAVPSRAHETPDQQLDAAAEALRAMSEAQNDTLGAIGISCPGPFDRSSRRFLAIPNMPAWQHADLGQWADRTFKVPTTIMNDANAAALAEHLWGGFDDAHVLVFLTMSTGLGAGIVIDGKVFEGRRGFAGEVGRIRLAPQGPVGFGAYGTSEGFASGPGIVQMATAERLRCEQAGESTTLRSIELSVPEICAAARNGDGAARRVIHESATRLGELIAILANTLEPDVVVLGTIGAAHPDLFIPIARESAIKHCHDVIASSLRIEPSRLDRRWERQSLAPAIAALG